MYKRITSIYPWFLIKLYQHTFIYLLTLISYVSSGRLGPLTCLLQPALSLAAVTASLQVAKPIFLPSYISYIFIIIIILIMHTFWLVLTYDLLDDRQPWMSSSKTFNSLLNSLPINERWGRCRCREIGGSRKHVLR